MRKLLLVFLACVGLAGVSAAAPILEFIGTPGIGTVSYDGSAGSLRGCGVLNTTRGGQSSGFGPIAFFEAGGSLSTFGSLDADSGAPLLGTGPIIFSGANDSSFLIADTGLVEIGGTGNDIKGPAFLAFFGNTNPNFTFDYAEYATPPPGYVGNTVPGLPLTPFTGATTLNCYTYNFNAPTPVAEPSALLLLGTGLLVGTGLLRRKSLG